MKIEQIKFLIELYFYFHNDCRSHFKAILSGEQSAQLEKNGYIILASELASNTDTERYPTLLGKEILELTPKGKAFVRQLELVPEPKLVWITGLNETAYQSKIGDFDRKPLANENQE